MQHSQASPLKAKLSRKRDPENKEEESKEWIQSGEESDVEDLTSNVIQDQVLVLVEVFVVDLVAVVLIVYILY
jgi:hypothetical protein